MSSTNYPTLADLRHQLHRLAESSGEEVRTQAFLLEQLRALSPADVATFSNSRSILAVFDGKEPGATLLFRGDFDAVRVEETIDVPYASETAGVAHKCGHDGHAAMLLGLARDLHQRPLMRGRVLLFFQAAEETGDGARQLLETGVLDRYTPDRVFALHNIPGEKLGTVLGKPGSFTCSVVSCEIVLKGRSAHAAEPPVSAKIRLVAMPARFRRSTPTRAASARSIRTSALAAAPAPLPARGICRP